MTDNSAPPDSRQSNLGKEIPWKHRIYHFAKQYRYFGICAIDGHLFEVVVVAELDFCKVATMIPLVFLRTGNGRGADGLIG